jgi:hypothetical protein
MKKKNIIILAVCGVVVVVGLVLGFTLRNSGPAQTPGKKIVTDTMAYLMEMQRRLDDRNELEEPQLCDCCDTPLVNGECPFCRGSCDQSAAAGQTRFNIVVDAPVTEIEGGGETGAPDAPAPADHGESENNGYTTPQ